MQLLLTSSGISNPSIERALVEMLGRPIADCAALIVPTAIYPYAQGATMAWQAVVGHPTIPLTRLGWKSLGILELTALDSIGAETWTSMVEEADALLFWGGNPVFLSYWLHRSGLAGLLPKLRREAVYVGVSAGSMASASTFGEAFTDPPNGSGEPISVDQLTMSSPEGDVRRTFVTAHGAGLVDFAVIPHLGHPDHVDASPENAKVWASRLPVPVYAIDDQTAIKVVDGNVEVVSEGVWKLFEPALQELDEVAVGRMYQG